MDRASDMSMSDDETAGASDEKTIEEMKRNEIINSLKNKTLILIKNDLIKAIEKDVEKVVCIKCIAVKINSREHYNKCSKNTIIGGKIRNWNPI